MRFGMHAQNAALIMRFGLYLSWEVQLLLGNSRELLGESGKLPGNLCMDLIFKSTVRKPQENAENRRLAFIPLGSP